MTAPLARYCSATPDLGYPRRTFTHTDIAVRVNPHRRESVINEG